MKYKSYLQFSLDHGVKVHGYGIDKPKPFKQEVKSEWDEYFERQEKWFAAMWEWQKAEFKKLIQQERKR
jgi:hypothetical protein